MLDQALDAAERLGELEELRPRDELDRLLLRLDEERDHAAEVAHLRARDCVAGMRLEPGPEHALDRVVALEELRDRAGRSRSAARMRTASVFSPRSTSHASNGPGTAPSDFCRK